MVMLGQVWSATLGKVVLRPTDRQHWNGGAVHRTRDAVTDEMGVDVGLPPGGIMHVHFEKDGRAHGVDVWDSVEAYEKFVQSTLMAATGKVAVARGLDPSKLGEPEVTITEVHRLVR